MIPDYKSDFNKKHPEDKETIPTEKMREDITSRLQENLASLTKLRKERPEQHHLYSRYSEPGKLGINGIKAMQKALEGDPDICNRLAEIAKPQFDTVEKKASQLCEMDRYLAILVRHTQNNLTQAEENDDWQKIGELSEIHRGVKSVANVIKKAAEVFAAETGTPWLNPIEQMEKVIKNSLSEETSIPNSRLTTHKATKGDRKIYAHILLESMLKGTDLEGHVDKAMIQYLNQFLMANKGKYQEIQEYSELLELYSGLMTFTDILSKDGPINSSSLNFSKEFNDRYDPFYSKLQGVLTGLKPGEQTLLPAGWTNKTGGHSMKLSIEKQQEGTFSLRLYNSGSGLSDYHYSFSEEGKTFYQPYLEITDVSEMRLLDPDFWRAYVEIMVVPGKNDKDTNYGSHHIYGIFLKGLDGKLAPPCSLKEKFMMDQQSGTCTWSSNLAVFHTLLPVKFYHSLLCDTSFDALCAHFQEFKGKILKNDFIYEDRLFKEMRILREESVKVAQASLDAYENKAISLEELKTIHASLLELQAELEEVSKWEVKSVKSERVLNIDSIIKLSNPEKTINRMNKAAPEKGGELKLEGQTFEEIPPFSLDWLEKPEAIVEGMAQLIDYLNKHFDGKHNAEATVVLESFFKLQAKKGSENLWKEIPQEHREQAIVSLADLGEFLFDASIENPYKRRIYVTYGIYLNALAALLAPNIPELRAANIDYYSCRNSYDGENISETLYEPEARELHRKLLKIMESQPSTEKRFGGSGAIEKEWQQDRYASYELNFIDDLIKNDPSLKERLEAVFPQTQNDLQENQSNEKYIGLGLCDWYGAVLPPAFCALRRLDMALTHLESEPLVRSEKSTYSSENELSKFDKKIYHIEVINARSLPKNTFDMHLLYNVQYIRTQQKRSGGDSEADIMLKTLEEMDQALELFLAKGDRNKTDSHLEQQLIKVISYYKGDIDRLRDSETRAFFSYILFEKAYLETVLEANPAFHRILSQFLDQSFRYFIEVEDIPAATFMLEMNRASDSLAKFKQIKTDTPPFRKQLLSLLAGHNVQVEDPTLIYQQIAASYQSHPPKSFTEEDAALLLKALVYENVFPLQKHVKSQSPFVKYQKKEAFQHWKKEIETLVKSEQGSLICNEIIKVFDPSFKDQLWDCKALYPYCTSRDGLWTLNIATHELYKKDKAFSNLPKDFFERPDFAKVFTKLRYPSQPLNNKIYEFVDERGITTQVKLPERSEKLVIRQHFPEGWYELITLEELGGNLKNLLPKDFVTLCQKEILYFSMDQNDHILIKNKDLKTTHCITLKEGKDKPIIESIQKMDEDAKSLVEMNSSQDNELKTLFGRGMLWKDKEGKFEKLELPSMGLSFSMKLKDGHWKAACDQFPGYFAAVNQQYRGVDNIPGMPRDSTLRDGTIPPYAIVLENKHGQKKLVVPFGEMKYNPNPFESLLVIDVKADQIQRQIVYDLDPLSQPIAKTKEQKIYLAQILLGQKKYKQAQELLKASFSLATPYTEKELSLLRTISEMPNLMKEKTPQASSLVLTALHLMVGRKEKKEIENEKMQNFMDNYRNYKNQAGMMPQLALTLAEEENALQYLLDQMPSNPFQSLQLNHWIHTLRSNENAHIYVPPYSGAKEKKASFSGLQYNSTGLISHPKFARDDFLKMYEIALKDPIKLEIYLAGAEAEITFPEEIITLLRCAARFAKNPQKNFPPSLQDMKWDLDQARPAVRGRAEAKELAASLQKENVKEYQVDLTGSLHPHYPLKAEAQRISVRKGEPALIPPIPPRASFLPKINMKCFTEIENEGLHLTDDEILELQSSITILESPDSKELSDKIAAYWGQEKLKEKWHLLAHKDLSDIKTLLLVNQTEMNKRLVRQELELLALANSLPEEMKELFEMEKMGHGRADVTINDLILFTARCTFFSLEGINPKLAALEKELLHKMVVYLDAKAEVQQLNRALVHLNGMQKINQNENSEYRALSEAFYQELIRRPPYLAHDNAEFLVFEVLSEKGLYSWQCSDLDRMLNPKENENPNVILEKVMGAGKTKIYLPLLALKKADGVHLPFLVVHSSQYDSFAESIQIQSGQCFHQVAHPLVFSRQSDTSVASLKKIWDNCLQAIENRHFMVVTDKSLHSLSLASDLLWDEYLEKESPDPDLEERIVVMREILSLFKEKGKAILDEADLLLNCRYEVVYAIGDPVGINTAHSDIVADLYHSIDPLLSELQPYTQSGYKNLKPRLIEAFVETVVKKKMKDCDSAQITAYLQGEKEGFDYVEGLSEERQNLLAIALYEFDKLLPIVLEKRSGVHFGYSDNPSKVLPVPYVASGVPSPSSEFSFPYVLLDYTVETLKAEGASKHLLKNLVGYFKNSALKEQRENPSLALQDTHGYKEFLKLCGDELTLPFLNIRDADIELLEKAYRKNPPDPYEFARKYLFPALTMNTRKLASTSFTLVNLFLETQGFTGTPYNSKTYAKLLELIPDINTAGKTQGIIWKNSQVVHNLSSGEFNEIMKELKEIHQDGSYHAFIDVGAVFAGIGNQEVATALLATLPKNIQGVLFFKDNLPHVLERDKKDPIPLSQCHLSEQKLYNYYDQWHTTGTDFKIAGKSLLSIGKNTKMRDLEQGYMRDRDAASGKRVEFLVIPEAQKFIQKELGLSEDELIKTSHILNRTENNQEVELEDQLMMASFGRMKECVNKHLHRLLLDKNIPPAEIHAKRAKIRKLIGEEIKDAPYEQFGKYQEPIDREIFFENAIQRILQEVKPALIEIVAEDALKKELWSCIDLELLPKKIANSAKQGPEGLMEQQSQSQAQQSRMAMVFTETLAESETSTKKGPAHWNWDSDLPLSSPDYYRVISSKSLENEKLPEAEIIKGEKISTSFGQVPFIPVKDLFENTPSLESFTNVFDIEASYNFLTSKGNAIFKRGQLNVSNVLICRDRNTNASQVRLISNADTGFFFQQLAVDREQANGEVDVALYNFNLGVVQSNRQEILDQKESIITDFIRNKIVQAKFFSGESIYSPEEIKLLTQWIKEKGPKQMQTLFCEHIIKSHRAKIIKFNNSPLSAFFYQFNKGV